MQSRQCLDGGKRYEQQRKHEQQYGGRRFLSTAYNLSVCNISTVVSVSLSLSLPLSLVKERITFFSITPSPLITLPDEQTSQRDVRHLSIEKFCSKILRQSISLISVDIKKINKSEFNDKIRYVIRYVNKFLINRTILFFIFICIFFFF